MGKRRGHEAPGGFAEHRRCRTLRQRMLNTLILVRKGGQEHGSEEESPGQEGEEDLEEEVTSQVLS